MRKPASVGSEACVSISRPLCSLYQEGKEENLGWVENKWIIAYFLSIARSLSLPLSLSAYPVERNEIIFYTLHAICFYFSSPRTSIGIVILKKLFLRAGLCNRFRRSLRPLRPTSYWQSFRLHVAGNRLPLITAICSLSPSLRPRHLNCMFIARRFSSRGSLFERAVKVQM